MLRDEMTTAEKMRHAANNLAAWDVPGLLVDAAAELDDATQAVADTSREQLAIGIMAAIVLRDKVCGDTTPLQAVTMARKIMGAVYTTEAE